MEVPWTKAQKAPETAAESAATKLPEVPPALERTQPAAEGAKPVAVKPKPRSALGRAQARVHAWREAHPVLEHALFFLGGFTFDVAVLDRIDHAATLIQHGTYLALLLVLVLVDQRQALVGDLPGWLAGRKTWVENVTHFLLGTLLNTFCVFYFKSGSGVTVLVFLGLLFGLLALNELPRFRARGPVVRLALYSFCLTSYLAYLYPLLAGALGRRLFIAAAATSSAVMMAVAVMLVRWRHSAKGHVWRAMLPAVGIQVLLVALHFFKLIPPVPLAVTFMGVYHDVKKTPEGEYLLYHQRPEWKLWQHGDQHFKAREGDRLYFYARVFAPTRFQDRIRIRWMYEDPKRGWRTTDVIPFTVTGGREQGFRGNANKKNFEYGDWRVAVETDDGREIGRLSFTVEKDAGTDERAFTADKG